MIAAVRDWADRHAAHAGNAPLSELYALLDEAEDADRYERTGARLFTADEARALRQEAAIRSITARTFVETEDGYDYVLPSTDSDVVGEDLER